MSDIMVLCGITNTGYGFLKYLWNYQLPCFSTLKFRRLRCTLSSLKSSCQKSGCVNSHSKVSMIWKCWLQKVPPSLSHMYLPRPNLAHLEGCRYVYVCVYVFDFCKNFVGTLNIMLDIIVLWGILLYFQSLMYTFNKSLKSSWYKKNTPPLH